MHARGRREQTNRIEPPPRAAPALGVALEVRHELPQEERRRVVHQRARARERHLQRERARVEAQQAVYELPARARLRAPRADAQAHGAERRAHRGEERGGAHVAGYDGEVADVEALGGVAEHDDLGRVREQERVPDGGACARACVSDFFRTAGGRGGRTGDAADVVVGLVCDGRDCFFGVYL